VSRDVLPQATATDVCDTEAAEKNQPTNTTSGSEKIRSRGLGEVGVGYSESTSPEIEDLWLANESQSDSSTPVETAKRVVDVVTGPQSVYGPVARQLVLFRSEVDS
jgi:hypothetical protein